MGHKRKRAGSAKKIAKDALKLARKNARAIETKRITAALITLAPSTTAVLTHLTPITQATTSNGRIGESINVTMVEINAWLQFGGGTADIVVRWIVLVDRRQRSDSAPVIADILATPTDPLSHIRDSSLGRFRILFDCFHSLDVVSQNSFTWRWRKRVNLDVRFNGVLSTDIERNGVYLVSLSNVASDLPGMKIMYRTTYKDG